MPSFNRVVLIGRLTKDPELRYTGSGLAVAKFSIAVDRRFKGQDGQKQTDFFDCSAFRQTAEFVNSYVARGRMVAVDGRIEFNEVTGTDGQKRKYTNIICDNVETLDSQRDAPSNGDGPPMPNGGRGQEDNGYVPDEEPQAAPPQRRPAPQGERAPQAERPERAPRNAPADMEEAPEPRPAPARGAGASAARGAAPAAPARGQGGARPAPQPAYPADDYDDSDPFADE